MWVFSLWFGLSWVDSWNLILLHTMVLTCEYIDFMWMVNPKCLFSHALKCYFYVLHHYMLWLWHWYVCWTWIVFQNAFEWERNLWHDCGESGSYVDVDPPVSGVVTLIPYISMRLPRNLDEFKISKSWFDSKINHRIGDKECLRIWMFKEKCMLVTSVSRQDLWHWKK